MPEQKSQQSSDIAQPPTRGVARVYRTKGELMVANFLGGIAWGVGSVLGATVIVAVIVVLLKSLGGVPLVGSFIHDLGQAISTTRH